MAGFAKTKQQNKIMEKLQISYEKTLSGYLVLSCIHEGQYYKRKYQGFSKKEATKHFKSLFEKPASFQII